MRNYIYPEGNHFFGVEVYLHEPKPGCLQSEVYIIVENAWGEKPDRISPDLMDYDEPEAFIKQLIKEWDNIREYSKQFFKKTKQ